MLWRILNYVNLLKKTSKVIKIENLILKIVIKNIKDLNNLLFNLNLYYLKCKKKNYNKIKFKMTIFSKDFIWHF